MTNQPYVDLFLDNNNENQEDNSMSINNNERYEAASTEAVSSVNPAEEATNATNETIQEGNDMTTSTSEQNKTSSTQENANGEKKKKKGKKKEVLNPRGPRLDYTLKLDTYRECFKKYGYDHKKIMKEMNITYNQQKGYYQLMMEDILGYQRPNARAGFAVSKDGVITITPTRLADNKVSKIFQPETKLFVRKEGNGIYIGLLEEKDDIDISVTRKSEQTQNTVENNSTDIPVTGTNQNQVQSVAA